MKIFVVSVFASVLAMSGSFAGDELIAKNKSKGKITVQKTGDSKSAWKEDVEDIDKEIDKLVNQRNLYLAKATRLQNQGDRLQFENNNLIDARRAWQQAQINREIATRIQEEIDALEERRQKILHKHGVKDYPKAETSAVTQ